MENRDLQDLQEKYTKLLGEFEVCKQQKQEAEEKVNTNVDDCLKLFIKVDSGLI